MRKVIAALTVALALTGCSAAPTSSTAATTATPTATPASRDTAAFLAGVSDARKRMGLTDGPESDKYLLDIGDSMCGLAHVSPTPEKYLAGLDVASRGVAMPNGASKVELVLVSGSALAHLCPEEKRRLESAKS